MIALLKADQQKIKNDIEKEKLIQQQIKTQQALAKEQDKANSAAKKSSNEYELLKQRYKASADEAKRLGAALGLQSKDFKNASSEAHKLHTQLLAIEQATGQSQRNVGNYKSAISGVVGEIGQWAVGLFALQDVMGTASQFISKSIDEMVEAEAATRNLSLSLNSVGKGHYFDGLVKEADDFAKAFGGVFDNDDIVKSQTELIKYGKFTREQLSELTKVAINLAAAQGTDLVTASNKLVDIMAGRGASTLRDFGLSLKGATTDADRLAIVTTQLSEKVAGAASVYAQSAEGIMKSNQVLIADTQEKLGSKLLPIYAGFLQSMNSLFEGDFKSFVMRVTGHGNVLDIQNRYSDMINKNVEESISTVNKLEQTLYKLSRVPGIRKEVLDGLKLQLDEKRAISQDKSKFNNIEFDTPTTTKSTAAAATSDKAGGGYLQSLSVRLKKEIEMRKKAYDEYLALIQGNLDAQQVMFDKADKAKIDADNMYTEVVMSNMDAQQQLFYKYDKEQQDAFQAKIDSLQATASIIDSLTSVLNDISSLQFDIEMERINKKDKALEDSYKSDLRRLESSGKSKQQIEKDKQLLEAQTEAQRKLIDKERAAAARKKAQSDRAADIANIITGTALAVVNALGSKPYTPLNIALAAAAGATGAAQLARAIATPLPSYEKGTQNHPGGYAQVSEAGQELVIQPDGTKYLTPKKKSIIHLPKGSKVIPNHELIKSAQNAAMIKLAGMGNSVTTDSYGEALIDSFENKIEKLIKVTERKNTNVSVNLYGGFESYVKSNMM